MARSLVPLDEGNFGELGSSGGLLLLSMILISLSIMSTIVFACRDDADYEVSSTRKRKFGNNIKTGGILSAMVSVVLKVMSVAVEVVVMSTVMVVVVSAVMTVAVMLAVVVIVLVVARVEVPTLLQFLEDLRSLRANMVVNPIVVSLVKKYRHGRICDASME